MYLVYMGESGNTDTSLKDSNQPHHVFAGLMIHEGQWLAINREFSVVCMAYLGSELGREIAPKQLIASQMYQGKGFFASWPKGKRHQLIDELLKILIRRETLLIVSYVDKEEFASAVRSNSIDRTGRGPWQAAFSRFVFSLDLYIDEMNLQLMPQQEQLRGDPMRVTERSTIIVDEAKGADSQLMQELIRAEIDIPTGSVIDNVFLARSEDSHCMQLADICAYCVRRYLQNPSLPNPQYTSLEEGNVLQVVYRVQF